MVLSELSKRKHYIVYNVLRDSVPDSFSFRVADPNEGIRNRRQIPQLNSSPPKSFRRDWVFRRISCCESRSTTSSKVRSGPHWSFTKAVRGVGRLLDRSQAPQRSRSREPPPVDEILRSFQGRLCVSQPDAIPEDASPVPAEGRIHLRRRTPTLRQMVLPVRRSIV